jgi:hypothetical protein
VKTKTSLLFWLRIELIYLSCQNLSKMYPVKLISDD